MFGCIGAAPHAAPSVGPPLAASTRGLPAGVHVAPKDPPIRCPPTAGAARRAPGSYTARAPGYRRRAAHPAAERASAGRGATQARCPAIGAPPARSSGGSGASGRARRRAAAGARATAASLTMLLANTHNPQQPLPVPHQSTAAQTCAQPGSMAARAHAAGVVPGPRRRPGERPGCGDASHPIA